MMIKKIIAVLGIALSISTFTSIGAEAAWKRNNIGWWYTEGSSWSVGWRCINNKWYYFDALGYMKTGWLQLGQDKYFLNVNGEMLTGMQNISGKTYKFDNNGKLIENSYSDENDYDKNNNESKNENISEDTVYNKIIEMKKQYPQGMKWDNSNSYVSKDKKYIGYGCAGFAYLLSDAAFDSAPVRKHTDFSNIRVGDILRIDNNGHSVIVLGFDEDEIIIAEGNMHFNGSSKGVINWGRKISRDYVERTGTYVMTRYTD